MGNREARAITVSYEDAVERVTPTELNRLKETFKHSTLGAGNMTFDSFMKDVFGDAIPVAVGEQLYNAFNGSGGSLTFKDLLRGLVLLTRGKESNDEKIKFLFGLYADENMQIQKEVIDEKILKTDGEIPEPLSELFEHSDRVDYERFKAWVLTYPEFSTLSNWLLLEPSDNKLTVDADFPSFYQTLAGVTHFHESEVECLEAKYTELRKHSATGRFDIDFFRRLVCPPMPRQLVDSLYRAFDENLDGHIDIKEMVCGISACCRGPMAERQKFCFRVFDVDRDGYLSRSELSGAIEASLTVMQQNEFTDSVSHLLDLDAYSMASEIIQSHGNVKENRLALEDYLVWAVQSKVPHAFADLLFEVCHVILGLQPLSREDEGKVVKGWLSREKKRGFALGQTWYLVADQWWCRWLDYVSDHVVLEAIHLNGGSSLNGMPNEKKFSRHENVLHPPKPGQIHNKALVQHHAGQVHGKLPTWTNEGGVLKKGIEQNKDYELLPEALWLALSSWYHSDVTLPRPVVVPLVDNKTPEIELYQCTVKLYKHQLPHQLAQPSNTLSGVATGIANMALQVTHLHSNAPKRVPVCTATFSFHHSLKQIIEFLSQRLRVPRDDLRLWKFLSENDLELLEGDDKIVADLLLEDGQSLLMETRNQDLTWPEEVLQIVKQQSNQPGSNLHEGPVECGITGLSNLGNTCFMNAAVQCVSSTQPLTAYFTQHYHLYELNTSNPLGMKGRLAKLYGELLSKLWSGTTRTIHPVDLRLTLAKYAPQFNGCQQHDAQELLAFLLDGLHEDLNRVQNKPYMQLKDSDGRLDEIVAKEGWEYHLSRNKSVIVDLFHGQLKSLVRCQECAHTSARFDPFTYLSLPLPMEFCLQIEVVVLRKNGDIPERVGFRLNSDDKYSDVREKVSEILKLDKSTLFFVELNGPFVKTFPLDSHKVKRRIGSVPVIYAYELNNPITLTEQETKSLHNQNGILPNGNHKTDGNGTADKSNCKPNGALSSDSSRTSVSSALDVLQTDSILPDGMVVAMHRKMERRQYYFLASQQTVSRLFGTPVIIQTTPKTTHKDVYHQVWSMIKRFVTGHPVAESCNHAMDCDESLGKEYPFILKTTKRNGHQCLKCPYYKFCKGCVLHYSDDIISDKCQYLVIDWDPTAYELRFLNSGEKIHESVEQSYNAESEPITVQDCLNAFTKEEHLKDEELYYCSKCKKHQLATKKLEIWRLPPILIIHLKRFQCLGNKWVKSQKSVDFPLTDFDPESYLVQRGMKILDGFPYGCQGAESGLTPNGSSVNSMCNYFDESLGDNTDIPKRNKTISVTSFDSLDYSQAKYDLYALTTHRGVMGGGHYVAYTKNPNGKWYEYNDSMVKEVAESSVTQMNKKNSYILFYERRGVNYSRIMPDVSKKTMDNTGLDEEFKSELKRMNMCLIQ